MYNQFLPSIGPLPNQIKSNHHSESNVLSWFFTLTFNFFSIESTLCDISLLIPLYLFHPSPGWPISYTCSALLQASNRQDQGITAFYSAKLGWVPTGPFLFMNTNLQKEKKRKKKKAQFWCKNHGVILHYLFYFVYWKSLINSFLLNENSLKFCCALHFQKFHTCNFI